LDLGFGSLSNLINISPKPSYGENLTKLINETKPNKQGLIVGFSSQNNIQNYIKWVIDSGPTDHMTENLTFLNNYRKINNDHFLRLLIMKKLE
jgi:hypothetical protein